MPLKKTNAADEIARTKFDLLDPVTITEMPRAQQRFVSLLFIFSRILVVYLFLINFIQVRQLDKYNRERVRQMFAKNKQMILWGWGLGAGCLSIYLYTMWVLRRETFLEEIDEEVAIERGELQVDDQGKPVKLAEK